MRSRTNGGLLVGDGLGGKRVLTVKLDQVSSREKSSCKWKIDARNKSRAATLGGGLCVVTNRGGVSRPGVMVSTVWTLDTTTLQFRDENSSTYGAPGDGIAVATRMTRGNAVLHIGFQVRVRILLLVDRCVVRQGVPARIDSLWEAEK